jgi:hypothetical protein
MTVTRGRRCERRRLLVKEGAVGTYVAMLCTVILGELVLKSLGIIGVVEIGLDLSALSGAAVNLDVIGRCAGLEGGRLRWFKKLLKRRDH